MKKIIQILLLLLVLLLLSTSWYFSSVLLYPPSDKFKCKIELFINCENPKKEFAFDYEDVEINSTDGITLSAWYIPSNKPSTKAVLSVHGRTSDRSEGMRYLPTIHNLGINVLMIDLRNNGKSTKSFSSMSFHERKDVHSSIKYLKEVKNISSIGILGFSMGGSTSIISMAENEDIKVGVFDSPFADFYRVTKQGAKILYGLPEYPLMPIVKIFYELRGNLDTNQMSPEKYIGKISPRPVLLLHGTKDEIVYYDHAESLFKAAKEPKELITVEGGEHVLLWQKDKRIEKKVIEYFSKL